MWGWLVCTVIFFAMGGLPLLALWSPRMLKRTWSPSDPDRFAPTAGGTLIGTPLSASLERDRRSPPPPPPPADGDVVARLERLAGLRDRGAIDAGEYERAKKAVLDE